MAGELTEQWRLDSGSWPAIDGEQVFVVQGDAVVGVDSSGAVVWKLAAPEGCGWLMVSADPLGVLVRGQVFADPYLHLRGVADRSTGALLWSERVSGREHGAMTDAGVDISGFYRGGWDDGSRQFFEPRTGAPVTPVFHGAAMHEYDMDGARHDVGYIPTHHAIGRVGPATLITDWAEVAAWVSPEGPLWTLSAEQRAHPLTATLFRAGSALIWLDPATGEQARTVAFASDACTQSVGSVRTIPGGGVLVRRCDDFDVLDAATGQRRATVQTADIPVFYGEASTRLRNRAGQGEAVRWYAPDTLIPGEQVAVPSEVEVEVSGDGLTLLSGTEAGFTRWTPTGSWRKTEGYGNLESHGDTLAWYHDGTLTLLDATTGQTRWQSPDGVLVGSLPDGTLIVRLSSAGAVIGLR